MWSGNKLVAGLIRIGQRCIAVSIFATILSWGLSTQAEVLVHETFSDNDILDGVPALWEGTCFQFECGPIPPSADLEIDGGRATVTIYDFAMWRLLAVDGEEIEPSNEWSIRARVTPQRGDDDEFVPAGSIMGVGLDKYYWGAGMHLSGADERSSQLAAGRLGDSEASSERLPFFEPWVVQIDVQPEGIEVFRWPVDDPSDIVTVSWSDGTTVVPALPIFWGNWSGQSIFDEVIVATKPMGVGGDFNGEDGSDIADLIALLDVVREESHDPRFNLTADEVVDAGDVDTWLLRIANSTYGDSDLDGTVGFSDFLSLSKHFGQAGSWDAGDFNGDNLVAFADFLILSQNFGVSNSVAAVPEPNSRSSLLLATLFILCFRLPGRRSAGG